tara:strand:+ start:1119 stop:2345 length:1227 start_codon:yes stop_codon:yes gene_type:complete
LINHNTTFDYNINPTKILGNIAVFLSLIPWFSFGLLSGDSMPWPFIAYALFLISIKGPIITPKNFSIFVLILTIGIFIAAFSSFNIFDENTIRSLYNFLGIAIFYIGFYNFLRRYGFPKKIFVFVNILWLLFAILEFYLPEVASIFSTARNAYGRGLTSLAPEATFFGIYLFFSSWIIISAENFKPSKPIIFLISLNLFFIIFLAQSSMTILYILIGCVVFFLHSYFRLIWKKQVFKITLVILLLMFGVIIFIDSSDEGSRFIGLYNQLKDENSLKLIFSLDGSLNSRLEHMVYSMHASFNNFLMPSGYDTFINVGNSLDVFYNYYFYYAQPSNKILSWTGDWLYQLGIFGLLFISYLFYKSSDGSRQRRSELILLFILLFSAIPLAFPMIPMQLAMYTSKSKVNAYS